MAITRPFGYNPSQNPIPGTDSYGTLVVGSDNLDFSQNPGGIKWWMGPDESLGYVIGAVASGGTQPSPVGDIGTVKFWRTGNLTSQEFINLANKISLQNFTTVGDAVTWLNANGYWTSYDPFVTPTPMPSATVALSPTPAVTPTPTVTPSGISIPEPLLDTYSGAEVAYSLRKIRTAYTGSAIRVRRSSDNAEQDIGFVNNQLDTTALTSFVGANNGFVTAWYDQSGNGKTAFQSILSRQPRIVNNGTIDTQINGKPSLVFLTGATCSLITSANVPANDYLSTFIVAKLGICVNCGGYDYIVQIGGTPANYPNNGMAIVMKVGGTVFDWFDGDAIAFGRGYNPGNGPRLVTNGSAYVTTAETNTITSVFLGSSDTGYYVNGVVKSNRAFTQGNVDATNTTYPLNIGSLNGDSFNDFDGYLSELVIYKSNQNSNKTGIEGNINGYYKIY